MAYNKLQAKLHPNPETKFNNRAILKQDGVHRIRHKPYYYYYQRLM